MSWYAPHLAKRPRARWTELGPGSRGASAVDLMVLEEDRMILLARDRADEEVWSLDDFNAVKITEDVGERYELAFESADATRPGPTLKLGSTLAFIVFFGTARRHKLLCRFEFTPRRLEETKSRVSDNTSDPWLRYAYCFVFSWLLVYGLYVRMDSPSMNFWLFCGIAIAFCVALGFSVAGHELFDSEVDPFALYAPRPLEPKPLELDGAPLAHRFLPAPVKKAEPTAAAPEPQNQQLQKLYDALD